MERLDWHLNIDGIAAYQCPVCHGISYPPAQDKAACPYCEEDDDDE